MRTPVLDDRPVRTAASRHRARWLVPIAAAAAIAAVASVPLWNGDEPETTPIASTPPEQVKADRAVLDAPGWDLEYASVEGASGETSYARGDQDLEIAWYPADSYDSYVEDRQHITEPPTDGQPVDVLGANGQLWAYSARDHTVMLPPANGTWIELRGSGMGEAAFLDLLGQVRPVDAAGFDAALPEGFVSDAERSAAIQEMLAGIGAVADPLWPADAVAISSSESDPYQLGADVAGAVACAWLDEFADAKQAGAQGRMDRAAAVLATAHDWPVLNRMNASGDYPEVLWEYADEVNAGRSPEGYVEGLGCR